MTKLQTCRTSVIVTVLSLVASAGVGCTNDGDDSARTEMLPPSGASTFPVAVGRYTSRPTTTSSPTSESDTASSTALAIVSSSNVTSISQTTSSAPIPTSSSETSMPPVSQRPEVSQPPPETVPPYAPTLWGNLPFAPSTEPADPLTLAKRFAWDMGQVRDCGDGFFPLCAQAVWGRHDPWNDVALYNTVFDRAFAKYEAHGAVITHSRSSAPSSDGAWSSYYLFEVAGEAFHVSVGPVWSGCELPVLCTRFTVSPRN